MNYWWKNDTLKWEYQINIHETPRMPGNSINKSCGMAEFPCTLHGPVRYPHVLVQANPYNLVDCHITKTISYQKSLETKKFLVNLKA